MRRPRLVGGHLAAAALAGRRAHGLRARARPAERGRQPGRRAGDDTLTIATTTDVVNFNPLIGNSRTDCWVTNLMYPRLLNIGADGYKEAGPGDQVGLRRRPHHRLLRHPRRLEWSDGKPLTAEDVAYTINAIKRGQAGRRHLRPDGQPREGHGRLGHPGRARRSPQPGRDRRGRGRVLDDCRARSTSSSKPRTWRSSPTTELGDWVSAGPYMLTEAKRARATRSSGSTAVPARARAARRRRRRSCSGLPRRQHRDPRAEERRRRRRSPTRCRRPRSSNLQQRRRASRSARCPGSGYAHMAYNMERTPTWTRSRSARRWRTRSTTRPIRQVVLQGQAVTTNSSPTHPVLAELLRDSVARSTRSTRRCPASSCRTPASRRRDGMFPVIFR